MMAKDQTVWYCYCYYHILFHCSPLNWTCALNRFFVCVNVTYSLAHLFYTHTIKSEEQNGIWMRYVCLGNNNNAWGVFVSKKMWRWPNTYANFFFFTKFAFITRGDGKRDVSCRRCGLAWSGHWASLSCSQLQFTINTHTI